MANEQEVREAFERRFADHAWFNPYSMDGDSYLDGSTNLAWEVWKAAAQAIRDQDAAKVAMLVDALKAYRFAYTPDGHVAPHDCFATGPLTGDPIQDLIACPGCAAQELEDKAISATAPEAEAFIREKQAEAIRKYRHELLPLMVERFLNWKLPKNFNPDAGISFEAEYSKEYMASLGKPPMRHEPLGTNLFDADQVRGMVAFMLGGISDEQVDGMVDDAIRSRSGK